MFTGQGSQYVGMGKGLFKTEPIFRSTLERCDEILKPLLPHRLLEVLYPTDFPTTSLPSGVINQTLFTQPALFAVEYALAELWQSRGIKPSVVLGHSVGEYVAAVIAGIFSMEEALLLISARGRLMQAQPAGGVMKVVRCSEEKVLEAIRFFESAQEGKRNVEGGGDFKFKSLVSVGAVNGPKAVVVSGVEAQVDEVIRTIGTASVPLQVSHAFHSPLMEPVVPELTDEFLRLKIEPRRPSSATLVSNVYGRATNDDDDVTEVRYWARRHVLEPVLFYQGVVDMVYEQGCDVIVEVGPQPVLINLARGCLKLGQPPPEFLTSLQKGDGEGDPRALLASMDGLANRLACS